MSGLSRRPSLPTTSSAFALPASTSSSVFNNPTPAVASDDLALFMLRYRLHSPRGYLSETRLHSPLAISFTIPRRYSTSTSVNGEESESDRDKMSTDSDSGSATPLLPAPIVGSLSDSSLKTSRPRSPATPPPRSAPAAMPSASSSTSDMSLEPPYRGAHRRRPSHALRVPSILRLISEAHPEENEVQSEAQFQRLVASVSALPTRPRTPRAASDRGRYPEEADVEENAREETPSDDGELDDDLFAYINSVNATKPVTPAQSINGDDICTLDSPMAVAMDVDLPSMSGSPIMSTWRYTPPPTSSAVRSNKRKLEDRYDPYPTVSKRRAVSPSLSYLRASGGAPRLSMPIPIPVPPSGLNSGASSPIIPSSGSYFSSSFINRTSSAMSSPTLRAQIGLSSPVLRPIIRSRRIAGDEEREVDGAGHAVNGLTLSDPHPPTSL
ncbi:hypothetical protein BKA93DRAFT_727029 [Sparassis latifolia]